jgi:peroxiredoxin
MAVRPRLLAFSLLIALVVSVPVGWSLSRIGNSDGVPADEIEEVVLNVPGEYQQPLDPGASAGEGGEVGSPLPAVTLEDAAGLSVSTAELVGAPSVVNVWFSTCPPCARELSDFAEVHREVGDRVRFVGINPFDGAEVMQRFASERGVAFELWRDSTTEFLDAVSVVSFPRTFFVDARGVVLAETGVIDAEELRRMIEELF